MLCISNDAVKGPNLDFASTYKGYRKNEYVKYHLRASRPKDENP